MLKKTTLFAAAIALSTTSVFAGGLSPEIIEAPAMEDDTMAAAGPSVNPTYIIVGLLAALVIGVALSEDDDDTPTTTILTSDSE